MRVVALMLKGNYMKRIVMTLCVAFTFVTSIFYLKLSPHHEHLVQKSYKLMVANRTVPPLYTLKSMTAQIQIRCTKWKKFGPHNRKKDGGWPVCLAKPFVPKKPCTIYSFGINNNWAFDDAYQHTYGCVIRTFDPSMGEAKEHEHSPGVYFYPLGLSNRQEVDHRGWHMDSYKGFLTRFGDHNKTIPYLKFDVEVSEWTALEAMLSDGSLKNVMQLAFEIHVPRGGNITRYIHLIQGLEAQGFRRWFFRHHKIVKRRPRFLFQSDQVYVNINFLPTGQDLILPGG